MMMPFLFFGPLAFTGHINQMNMLVNLHVFYVWGMLEAGGVIGYLHNKTEN